MHDMIITSVTLREVFGHTIEVVVYPKIFTFKLMVVNLKINALSHSKNKYKNPPEEHLTTTWF